jgi:hypothetical protein
VVNKIDEEIRSRWGWLLIAPLGLGSGKLFDRDGDIRAPVACMRACVLLRVFFCDTVYVGEYDTHFTILFFLSPFALTSYLPFFST